VHCPSSKQLSPAYITAKPHRMFGISRRCRACERAGMAAVVVTAPYNSTDALFMPACPCPWIAAKGDSPRGERTSRLPDMLYLKASQTSATAGCMVNGFHAAACCCNCQPQDVAILQLQQAACSGAFMRQHAAATASHRFRLVAPCYLSSNHQCGAQSNFSSFCIPPVPAVNARARGRFLDSHQLPESRVGHALHCAYHTACGSTKASAAMAGF
jgi:hypothetical protein